MPVSLHTVVVGAYQQMLPQAARESGPARLAKTRAHGTVTMISLDGAETSAPFAARTRT